MTGCKLDILRSTRVIGAAKLACEEIQHKFQQKKMRTLNFNKENATGTTVLSRAEMKSVMVD